MDRSRRTGAKGRASTADLAASSSSSLPSSSRLTLRPRKNRRRPAPLWSRLPPPREIADACGRALRRSLPAAIATCAILVVGGGLWLGYTFLTTSDRYAITAIEIRGARHLSPDEIRSALPVAVGDNIFRASPDDSARALRSHPWIAAASAQRILPGTLLVEIREHEAAAIAVIGDAYLIGPDGHPFKRARIEDGEAEGLPLITGLDRTAYARDPIATARAITAALDALARWRAQPGRPAIGELHIGAQGALTLRTSDRAAAIDLGPLGADTAAVAARLRTFDAVWAELQTSERDRGRAKSFHLDARPDHVTVAFAKD